MDATTPREHDTKLAEMYHKLARAEQRVAYNTSHLLSLAGAKYYYRGRRRVTDMTLDEALAKVTEARDYIAAYKAEHGYVEHQSYTLPSGEVTEYDYHGTNWDEYEPARAHGVMTYQNDEPEKVLAQREELLAEVERVRGEIDSLEEGYTGWSRFFVVTSSAGHIHSSTWCSSCRPTTTYGWLPELSGKTEAEAVEAHGPALCSICYPSAPTDWVGGKISKAQAEKKAH